MSLLLRRLSLPSSFATLRWFRLAVLRVFAVEAAVLRLGRAALLLAPRLLRIWVVLGEPFLVAGLVLRLLQLGSSAISELRLNVSDHALLSAVVGI